MRLTAWCDPHGRLCVSRRAAIDQCIRRRLESVLGKDVATLREGDSGRVIDLLIDGHGHVRAAVVEFGGFLGIGTRKIAVDWAAFRFAGKSIWVDVTREQLRAAAEYKANEPPFIVQAISAD